MELGAYECLQASDNLSEPEWPSKDEYDYWALLRIAGKDYLVKDLAHPVVKRLRGQA